FSASSIAEEVGWLHAERRDLATFDLAQLTPDERVDHRILGGVIDGWLLDLDTVRTWQRNPMIYAAAVSDGVHNLMTMASSPAPALLAIGERELKTMQAEFTAAARRVAADRSPLDVWRDVLEDHPKRGEVAAAAQKTVDELFAFIRAHRLVDLPEGERVVVAA